MIVYNDIKRQFVNDVKDNSIADKILEAIRMRGLNAGHEKEYSSWQNSMQFMRNMRLSDALKMAGDKVSMEMKLQLNMALTRIKK